jgi:hypothetical protein
MKMHGTLRRLGGLVDPATVLGMYGATVEDVELLAALEDELRMPELDGGTG